MPRQELPGSAEQPLQGVTLCFTSIGPEDRTRYADIAMQMGADHKLDLTSDTTHLIVGDTDTLKYRYVAREREDIKVLRPEWIEAVRDQWTNALPLDLEVLTEQHRLPALAGLKICITGFDDLSFRAQLQKNVKDNGGDYTGDLTKDVTHLIANKPEGKKYEYGMQWQKKVVSLKWYKDSLERGMQLDEALYHPTVPASEQGVGAWNRKPRKSPQLGKRSREDNTGSEPSRKLRRTASARLGSQSQDMWSDIVGGVGFETASSGRPPLKPSKSMPGLRRPETTTSGRVQSDKSYPEIEQVTAHSEGYLAGCHFMVQCREPKKNEQLHNILTSLGATIIDDDETQATIEHDKLFVILPHDVAKLNAVPEGAIPDGFQMVSELWLEKCMIAKAFIPPQSYPLGQVIVEPRASLKGSTVNVSGFDGLETVQIIKIVTLLGGAYDKSFTSAVSLLICRSAFANKEKLELARHLNIPVVAEEWLWSTMKRQAAVNATGYLLQPLRAHVPKELLAGEKRLLTESRLQGKTTSLQQQPGDQPVQAQAQKVESTRPRGIVAENAKKSITTVTVHQEERGGGDEPEIQESSEHANASGRSETQEGSQVRDKRALRELSPTSARRNGQIAEQLKAPIRSFDGASSMEHPSKENGPAAAETGTKPADIEAINGALRDILNERSKKTATRNRATDDPKKKNRLIGRALSNLSNTSSTSNVRHSRASSIDSINTDGRGSEIPAIQSGETQRGESTSAPEKKSFSFTGRAKTALAGLASAAFAMDDPDLVRAGGFQAEQEAPPRMTQLGYEDPEEAVLLREKLAASRKKRAKKTGGEKDEEQVAEPKPAAKQKPADRKIRDDDILAGAEAGWGAGRRTRHKQRSPQGIKDF
ncbi:protein kinase activating protein dpb11 [Cladophialophora chaetospira]|uniref:Protein kinase activating protein dpb11 n=1 Tax=Cladophialophora chaetospira TaxID=386627 RepID=A0AA38WXH6_9EURO|nr:protein kinase activating protein dpb11 [Cladophialophora chaetospira]